MSLNSKNSPKGDTTVQNATNQIWFHETIFFKENDCVSRRSQYGLPNNLLCYKSKINKFYSKTYQTTFLKLYVKEIAFLYFFHLQKLEMYASFFHCSTLGMCSMPNLHTC